MNARRNWPVALAAGFVFSSAAALAADPNNQNITLDDCVQMALQKNLDIRIAKLSPSLAQSSLYGSYGSYEPVLSTRGGTTVNAQAGGLDAQNRVYLPSTSETAGYSVGVGGSLPTGMTYDLSTSFNDNVAARGGERAADSSTRTWNLSFTQPILKNFWIDAPRMNISLSKKNLESSEETVRNQIISTVTDVEVAYYELIAAKESIVVSEIALQLAEQLLRENQKRVEVGVLAPLDEKEAQSQVAASRATLLGAQNTYAMRQNALKKLLGDQFAAWLNTELVPTEQLTTGVETFSLQDSWSKGIANRPDLKQAKINLEKLGITLRYQKNQLYPQLDVTGFYGQSGSTFQGVALGIPFSTSTEGLPSYGVGGVLSIPLGGNRSARSAVRTTKINIDQAMLQLKQLEQNVLVQIDDAIAQARTSYQQVKATEEAAAFALDALRAEEKKMENGKSTSFQVLTLQNRLTVARQSNIRARVDYNNALARLAQSEGSTLERRRINLEYR